MNSIKTNVKISAYKYLIKDKKSHFEKMREFILRQLILVIKFNKVIINDYYFLGRIAITEIAGQ